MSETLYVTPAQVLAAKLAVELSEEEGKEPGEALRAIANATVVSEEDALGDAADYTANLTQEATDAVEVGVCATVARTSGLPGGNSWPTSCSCLPNTL